MEPIIGIRFLTDHYQNIEHEVVTLEKSYFSIGCIHENELCEIFISHYPENGVYLYIIDSNGYVYELNSNEKTIKQLSRRLECKIITMETSTFYCQSERFNENKELYKLENILAFAHKRAEKL